MLMDVQLFPASLEWIVLMCQAQELVPIAVIVQSAFREMAAYVLVRKYWCLLKVSDSKCHSTSVQALNRESK